MTIENVTPNILQLNLAQERNDEDYGSCLWCKVTFDLDSYALLVNGDCGDFVYNWVPTPNTEGFLELMTRIEGGYLLGKISNRNVFNLNESIKQTCSNLEECCDDVDTIGNAISEIKELIDEGIGEEMFYTKCMNILGEYKIYDSFEIISVEKEYPSGAAKFAEIFTRDIQPYLKKLINERETYNE